MHISLGPKDARRGRLGGSGCVSRAYMPVRPGAMPAIYGRLWASHARRRAGVINALVGVAPIRLPASVPATGAVAPRASAHGPDAAHRPGPCLALAWPLAL